MFEQGTKKKAKRAALNASELALQLAQDRRFRKQLRSAIRHGSEAGRRGRQEKGIAAAVRRFAADQAVQTELRRARKDLQRAYARLEKKRRTRKLRKLVLVAGLASLAFPQVRSRIASIVAKTPTSRSELGGLGTLKRTRSLEDLTKDQLYARAQDADIPGRSDMSKDELIAALRAKS